MRKIVGSRLDIAHYGRALLAGTVILIGASVPRAVDASNLCIAYSYDGTGNRTAMTTAVATPTWGTAIWACFTWTPQ